MGSAAGFRVVEGAVANPCARSQTCAAVHWRVGSLMGEAGSQAIGGPVWSWGNHEFGVDP